MMKSGINFLEMGWRNFLSYGNNLTVISLDFTKPTVIIGRNLDDSAEGENDSNGAGKSTILNVLSYVCYDETIGKIKKDDLINWYNLKNMEAYVIFKKGSTFYKIERFRKFSKKGGDGLKILTNTTNNFTNAKVKDITRDSVSRANEQIVEILGTPFDVFARVVLLSSSTESFFSLPATSAAGKACQRDILEELFGYTEISKKSEVLKEKIKLDKKELDRLFELNKQLLEEADRLKSQVEFTEEQFQKWIIDNEAEVKKLEVEIEKQSKVDFNEEKEIFEQISKLELKIQAKQLSIKEKELVLNNIENSKIIYNNWNTKRLSSVAELKSSAELYSKIDFKDQEKLYEEIETASNAFNDHLNKKNVTIGKISEISSKIKEYESELSHLTNSKCPYCLQDFKDVKIKISDISAEVVSLSQESAALTEDSNELEAIVDMLHKKLKTLRSQLVYKTRNEMNQNKMSSDSLAQKILDKSSEVNPHTILSDSVDTKGIETLKADILALRDKIDKFKQFQTFSTEQEMYTAESSLKSNKKALITLRERENPHIPTLNKLKATKLPANKNDEIEELKDDLEHEELLYKLLTKKDSYIRKALLNKNLPFLNNRLKHHLSKTGLPHKVMFTENMTASITKFGVQVPYTNFSKGQEARLNLATSFAFRDVLQTRHEKINLCMLDEYFDSGLSHVGVAKAIKMTKEIAKEEKIPIFIISHRDEVASMFDSKIEVEMYNKFSNIVKSDLKFSSTE